MSDVPANDDAFLAALLADSATWAEPRAGLEDAVLDAVAAAPPALRLTTAEESARREKRSRRRIVMAGVAAAAAVAIVLGTVFTLHRGPTPQFAAELQATPIARGASASVDIMKNRAGFRVDVDAHGLPVLRAGMYYEAWLQDDVGTRVPIGTFSSSAGEIVLWSGVSPQNFSTMSVTIESTDNVQASSGRRVLTGDLHSR